MMQQRTAKERMDRLRAALLADQRGPSQLLAARMDRCHKDWKGRYECRAPACLHCRRRHIAREQRVMQQWFGHYGNADLAFVTVVLEATTSVADLGYIISRSREATRKRIAACRKKSARWNEVYVAGWHEVDAVAPDQVGLLPTQRRGLIEQLVPWSVAEGGPAWIGTYHSIMHLNGLAPQDVAAEFGRQWKLAGQVDVQPFDVTLPVAENIDNIVSYANKFSGIVHLNDSYIEPWPVSWETTYFGWLQSAQRNPFEALRLHVGPKQQPPSPPVMLVTPKQEVVEVLPMPCLFSVNPTYEYTGGWR